MVLAVDGEGRVVLDRGVWVGGEPGAGRGPGDVADEPDDADRERSVVARWLAGHTGRVRILEVESPLGMVMPAHRIPELAELCGRQLRPRSAVDSAA